MAADAEREMSIANSLAENIEVGKPVWLETERRKFLGIYTTTEAEINNGTVIILHDAGGNPNQDRLIHELRTQLPLHNWATFSLQMPLLEANANQEDYYDLFPDALARINSAIDYLVEAKVENIVLVGEGMGALITIYVLNDNTMDIKAAVVIGLPVPKTEHKSVQVLSFLENLELPMLDLYSYFDAYPVVATARKRRLSAKKNKAYRQDEINSEGRLYPYQNRFLVKRIHGWLSKVLPKNIETTVVGDEAAEASAEPEKN